MNLDFLQSPLGDDPLIFEALFPAPVARVYRAWIDPDRLKKWFGPRPGALLAAEVDLAVGGRWAFTFEDGPDGRNWLEGEYIEIEPERRLVFSWRHVRTDADGARTVSPDSRVTVAFETHGAATRVRLRHEGMSSEEARRNAGGGWSGAFGNLTALLAADLKTDGRD